MFPLFVWDAIPVISDELSVYPRLESATFHAMVAAVGVTSLSVSYDVCAARVFDAGEADRTYVDARRLGLSPSVEQALQEWPRETDSVFEFARRARLMDSAFRPRQLMEEADFDRSRLFGPIEARCRVVDCFCLTSPLGDHAWMMLAYLRCGESAAFTPAETRLLERIKTALTRTIKDGYDRQSGSVHRTMAQNGGSPAPRTNANEIIMRLSRTERQVLQYLFTPATERQIAQSIHRSPHTVHVHVKNIYRKLGINSRSQLQTMKSG